MVVPPVWRIGLQADGSHIGRAGPHDVGTAHARDLTAGTWKVWVFVSGMDAEYIGLNLMASELGFEQAPPPPADPSGDAPDDEELEHAEIPPPTARIPRR